MRSATRLMIVALLGLALALPALPAVAAPEDDVDVANAQRTTSPSPSPSPSPGATAPSGPKLQPDTEADEAERNRKLIMGATSVVLVGLVIWGRSIRRKKRKAAEGK